jgi:hypothetical protein
MKINLIRIIIFTPNVSLLLGFYSELLKSSKTYIDEDGKWGEIKTDKTNIAFHNGKKRLARVLNFKPVFYFKDINKCRLKLIKRGYSPGKIFNSREIEFFNLNDPDGNVIQFSNRK